MMRSPDAEPSGNAPREGEFWLPGSEDRSQHGHLALDSGGYRLTLEELIAPSARIAGPAADGSVRIEFGAAKPAVEDFRARVIHGILTDGTPVTLLDAHMKLGIPLFDQPHQSFEGHQILFRAHVASPDVPVYGVRWKVGLASAPWTPDDVAQTSMGELTAWNDEHHAGLSLTFSEPTTLAVAAAEVPLRTSSIFSVAQGRRVAVLHREVLMGGDNWCPLGSNQTDPDAAPKDLLAGHLLDLNTISTWIEAAGTLDHIPYVAAATGIVLELHVLAVLTALEGLHRRCHPGATALSGVSSNAIKRAAKAAATAAAESICGPPNPTEHLQDATDRERVYLQYRQCLGHVADPTYEERLRELLAPVAELAPELFRPGFDEWLGTARRMRNSEGHALEGLDQFNEQETKDYVRMKTSGQWALRLRLLLIPLTADDLAAALGSSSTFAMALAKIEDLLRR